MNRTVHQMELEPEEHDLRKKAFVMAIRDALNVVSGKWKLAIICTLLSGPKGFSDIERLLATISPRMLARELRELEVNGAIARTGSGSLGKGAKYTLTPSGAGLEKVAFMLAELGAGASDAFCTPIATRDLKLPLFAFLLSGLGHGHLDWPSIAKMITAPMPAKGSERVFPALGRADHKLPPCVRGGRSPLWLP